MKKFKMDTKMMVTAGILIALNIILSRFLSINAWNLKIGFTFVSLFVAAFFYGPIFAAIVAGVADVIGAILFPSGAFFPGFTLTAILMGLLYGVLLHRKQTKLRIGLVVVIGQLVLSLLLNTYWLSILYGSPFAGLILTRIVQCFIMTPVEFITMSVLSKMLAPLKKEVANS